MTVAEWLAERSPAPPQALMDRILVALGPAASGDATGTPDRCLDAAERVVAELLSSGRIGRESATDLLAADALVTYAFEAASDDSARLVDRARAAMQRLSRLGTIDVAARANDRSAVDPSRR